MPARSRNLFAFDGADRYRAAPERYPVGQRRLDGGTPAYRGESSRRKPELPTAMCELAFLCPLCGLQPRGARAIGGSRALIAIC
jgi:hypothetical protein